MLNDIKTELILSKSINPISGKLNRLNIFGLWCNSGNWAEHEVQQHSHSQRMQIPFLPSKSQLHTQKRKDGKIYSSLSQFLMRDHSSTQPSPPSQGKLCPDKVNSAQSHHLHFSEVEGVSSQVFHASDISTRKYTNLYIFLEKSKSLFTKLKQWRTESVNK